MSRFWSITWVMYSSPNEYTIATLGDVDDTMYYFHVNFHSNRNLSNTVKIRLLCTFINLTTNDICLFNYDRKQTPISMKIEPVLINNQIRLQFKNYVDTPKTLLTTPIFI